MCSGHGTCSSGTWNRTHHRDESWVERTAEVVRQDDTVNCNSSVRRMRKVMSADCSVAVTTEYREAASARASLRVILITPRVCSQCASGFMDYLCSLLNEWNVSITTTTV